jgi:hypothetical protein
MAPTDPLRRPFANWQERLFALPDALSHSERERMAVARLEATAARNSIGLKEICSLALLVPSRAGLGASISHRVAPFGAFV